MDNVYIGETSKCPNVRLEEHLSYKSKYASFTEHWKSCGCQVDPLNCKLLVERGLQGMYSRKLVETLCIEEALESETQVISNPSIMPTAGERLWFKRFPPLRGFN